MGSNGFRVSVRSATLAAFLITFLETFVEGMWGQMVDFIWSFLLFVVIRCC